MSRTTNTLIINKLALAASVDTSPGLALVPNPGTGEYIELSVTTSRWVGELVQTPIAPSEFPIGPTTITQIYDLSDSTDISMGYLVEVRQEPSLQVTNLAKVGNLIISTSAPVDPIGEFGDVVGMIRAAGGGIYYCSADFNGVDEIWKFARFVPSPIGWDDVNNKPAVIAAGDTVQEARDAIGLGTAAMADSSAFATATQGGKADSALQPNAGLAAIDSAANTKLGGIAAGATANATDAQLRDRSTHTGTQPMATITDKQGKVLDDLIEIEDAADIDTTFAVGGYIIKEDDLNGYLAGTTMLVSANGGVVSQLISVPILGKIAMRRYKAGVWSGLSFTLAPFDVQLWYSGTTSSAADAVINADGTFSRSLFVSAPLAPKITASLTAASDTDILRPAALTTATTFPNPTGSPMDGFGFVIELIDDGTARALTWGSDYAAGFAALPTTTTAGKLVQIAVQYRSGKYRCDGVRWMA